MSIQEMENRITAEAQAEASRINKEAEDKIQQLKKVHLQDKAQARARILREAQLKAEEIKRSYMVPSRLKARNAILEEKQKIISSIYEEIKKDKNLSIAEIKRIREETEVKAAGILFGD